MANCIFQRWMPPVYSSYPTCSTYNEIDAPSPRGGSLFPSLKSGCRLMTAQTLKVRQTWSYGVSEAVREKMQAPPGVLPWRHLALDWWWLCWGDQVERSHRSRDPWLRSPSSPSWEDDPRLQTHGWRSLRETLPPAAGWLQPHEKPKPELTSQATVMFPTHRNRERWKQIVVGSSHAVLGNLLPSNRLNILTHY